MEFVQDFFNFISNYLGFGIFEMFRDFGIWIITKIMVAYFETKIFLLNVSYTIAQSVIQTLQVSEKIAAAFSHIDSKYVNMAYFLRIPECLNILLSAYMMRIALRFIPFA